MTQLDREHCLICGGEGRPWIAAPGRHLQRCRTCQFAWMLEGVKHTATGRSIYDDSAPLFLDPEHADYYRDETAIDAARAKLEWVRSHARAGGRLLDVGANVGLFAREAAGIYDALGIEPGDAIVKWARETIGAPVQVGSIYDAREEFAALFDAVTLFDVIEHLQDPEDALRRCQRFLKPGGLLFVTTPDSGSLMSRLLGRHWYYVDMDEHIALFNRAHLQTLLERTGFDVVDVKTVGRSYKFSYIARRLRFLGRQASILMLAGLAAWPLRFWPSARMRLDFGDVMGVVARRK